MAISVLSSSSVQVHFLPGGCENCQAQGGTGEAGRQVVVSRRSRPNWPLNPQISNLFLGFSLVWLLGKLAFGIVFLLKITYSGSFRAVCHYHKYHREALIFGTCRFLTSALCAPLLSTILLIDMPKFIGVWSTILICEKINSPSHRRSIANLRKARIFSS